MTVPMKLEPADDLPSVRYRWDADTGILVAELARAAAVVPAMVADGIGVMLAGAATLAGPPAPAILHAGVSGSLSLEGEDGSWIILDLDDDRVRGVQVAVWPYLHRLTLQPPPARAARARLSLPRTPGDTFSVEVSAPVRAEVDLERRHVRLRFGRLRAASVFAIASGVLLELDSSQSMSGLWLLDVPPSPTAWTAP